VSLCRGLIVAFFSRRLLETVAVAVAIRRAQSARRGPAAFHAVRRRYERRRRDEWVLPQSVARTVEHRPAVQSRRLSSVFPQQQQAAGAVSAAAAESPPPPPGPKSAVFSPPLSANAAPSAAEEEEQQENYEEDPTLPPLPYSEVVVVETVAQAERVLSRLWEMDPDTTVHAVDTEVADIDLKTQGPVGHGFVTCFTVYSGPEAVYDETPGQTLFVETLDDDVLEVFRPWLSDDRVKKVWHNYGFDRHVLETRGLTKVGGFFGDTMHMARLEDAARQKTRGGDGYSLEALSADYLRAKKVSMRDLFGLKSTTKLNIRELQGTPEPSPRDASGRLTQRAKFACYAAYDAKATWELRATLASRLQAQSWEPIIDAHNAEPRCADMLDFYKEYMLPFGELLTDMEKDGVYVDAADHLSAVQKKALADKQRHMDVFRDWAIALLGPDDGAALNPSSTQQIQTLLYGGAKNQKTNEYLPHQRDFDIDNSSGGDDKGNDTEVTTPPEPAFTYVSRDEFAQRAKNDELKAELRKLDEPVTGTKAELQARFLAATDPAERQRRLRPPPLGDATTKEEEALATTTTTTTPTTTTKNVPPPPLKDATDEAPIDTMTVRQLKDALRARGRALTGRKADLKARLLEAKADDGRGETPAEAAARFWNAKTPDDLKLWARVMAVENNKTSKKKDLTEELASTCELPVVQAIDVRFNAGATTPSAGEIETMDKEDVKNAIGGLVGVTAPRSGKVEVLRRFLRLQLAANEEMATSEPEGRLPRRQRQGEEDEQPPQKEFVARQAHAAAHAMTTAPLLPPDFAAAAAPAAAAWEEHRPSLSGGLERLDELSDESLRGMCLGRCIRPPPDANRGELMGLVAQDDAYATALQRAQRDGPSQQQKSLSAAAAYGSSDSSSSDSSSSSVDEEESDVFGFDDEVKYKLASTVRKKKHVLTVEAQTIGLKVKQYTAKGWPAVTMGVLRSLAGGNPREGDFGDAYAAFGCGESGEKACLALDALCQMSSIETMLSTFIGPLQELRDETSRIHCSLNLNTETGRLSSRRPNLQNQPALEKDKYHIRKAFRAEEGNMLVVADYGQLELRLLAAITGCESMLAAFRDGGCFHSRTAVGMFDHVRRAVDDGEVLLEKGERTGDDDQRPLVKDKYAAERRKAKTLNFSIAYGKTAHGLSKDWGVSPQEAKALLDAWYADRPEVLQWQTDVIAKAKKTGYTTTLMGRRRQLPDIQARDRKLQSRGARAAINTPIQGSAADVVMMAMLNLKRSDFLRDNGWRLLLQIHDEVILEGPEDSTDAALNEVTRCMEYPFDNKGLKELDVALTVDASSAKTWYDAK